jgi:hypothetical protein
MNSNYQSVPVYGKDVKSPFKITYFGDIKQKTYKKFFVDDFKNVFQKFYSDYIFIIVFINNTIKHIECNGNSISEFDIHNNFKKYISADNIEVEISYVEIVHKKDILSGGRKAPVVKKEINGKLRCIYTIAGSRKEHLKYKGRLIAVADYKKLMKKV